MLKYSQNTRNFPPLHEILHDEVAVFLDEVWAEVLQKQWLRVKGDLLKCGFVINEEKSLWEPMHINSWLGIVLNSRCNRISVTELEAVIGQII